MKYVANLFAPIPKAPRSHVLGWSMYWADNLQATILRDLTLLRGGDVVYVDHGVNFSGGLNLFGGVSDELATSLAHLVRVGPPLVSLDIPMPDYAGSLAKRIGQASTSKLLTPKLVEKFGDLIRNAGIRTHPFLAPKSVVFGDSHSTAYANSGDEVHRTNGLTLHGLLENWDTRFPDLSDKRYRNLSGSVTGVTIVAGSIDVRHHLMRRPDPSGEMRKLVARLIAKASELESAYCIPVRLCAPVPVEYEGRPIPKTGYYDGQPFYGSQAERARLTQKMIEVLVTKWGGTVVLPPAEWYQMDPEEYASTVMERGGSVHISPTHYRSRLPSKWRLS